METVFSIVIGGTLDSLNCYKGTLLKKFYWKISEIALYEVIFRRIKILDSNGVTLKK